MEVVSRGEIKGESCLTNLTAFYNGLAGSVSPCLQHQLMANCLASNFAEKDLEALEEKLTVSQQCAPAAMNAHILLDYIKKVWHW